jgi:transposase-like protein
LGHVSRTAVSDVCRELRDRYRAFRAKSLADVQLVSFMLDAIYLPTRRPRWKATLRVPTQPRQAHGARP